MFVPLPRGPDEMCYVPLDRGVCSPFLLAAGGVLKSGDWNRHGLKHSKYDLRRTSKSRLKQTHSCYDGTLMRGGKIKSYPHDSKSTHRPTLRAQSSEIPRRRRLTSDWEGCRGGGLHSAGKHYVRQENLDYYRKKEKRDDKGRIGLLR